MKKFIKNYVGKLNAIGLKNRQFTIISNNCWGGFIYQRYGLQYNSPFIGLFLFAPDYIELLENFNESIYSELSFIKAKESKYKDELIKCGTFEKYPIGKLGENIEIHFLHYSSEDEARVKWNKRVKRINENNILVKFCDRDKCTSELIERFDKLTFENKLCFTAKKYNLKSVITFREFEGKENVEEEWISYKKYIDIKKILNTMVK